MAEAEAQAIREVYLEQKVLARITDDALQTKYQDYLANNPPATEHRARHILVTSEAAAREVIAKLDEGADFAELAKENSDDPTSANLGGDMGWFPPQAYGERVYQTLIAMQEGETSEPFQTAGGWHIMELLGKREIDRTEEAIRAEARDKIRQRKAEQEVRKVLRQFRDEAFVEIRLPGRESTSG